MATNPQDLGRSIQQARKTAGLTQDALSDKAGLAYSTLAKIERGAIQNPSVFTVAGLAQAMGITVEHLLGLQAPEVPTGPVKAGQLAKILFVDVNGVLARSFQGSFTRLAEESGVHIERIENLFWHYNDAVCRGELSVPDFNQQLSRLTGVEKLDWTEYYLEAVQAIMPMHQALHELSKEIKVGLLTNTFPGLIEPMIQRGLLPNLEYAAIIESASVKAVKPQLRIYEAAEAATGAHGAEIIFVDDNRTNLSAAEKLGWRVIWFDDYQVEESVRRVKAAVRRPSS